MTLTITPEIENPREALLSKANSLVNGDRNRDYDDPEDNFQRISNFFNDYLDGIGDRDLRPHDVALLNILQKIARLQHTTDHADSWVDIAGYAACGWDCIVQDSLNTPPPAESLAQVIPLLPDREQIEDLVVVILDRESKAVGEALYYTDSGTATNRDQVIRWLTSKDEYPWLLTLVLPGYWYVSFEGEPTIAMDPETLHDKYVVTDLSVA